MLDQAPMKLTPEQQKQVEDKVIKAKARLILDHPFFGMAVSKRDIKYCYDTPTASMDAVGQMRLNPHFVANLSKQNMIFL